MLFRSHSVTSEVRHRQRGDLLGRQTEVVQQTRVLGGDVHDEQLAAESHPEFKVKKELTDVALLAVEIAKYKDTPAEAAKAIADYFNGTSKKE